MVPDQQVLSKLIGKVYEAATDPTLWKLFLEEFAQAAKANASALVMHQVGKEVHTVAASWRVAPDASRLYQQHYGAIDVWAIRGRSKPAGYVCTSSSLCPPQELARTEIYNDYMVRYGVVHGMFGLIENNAARWASVSLYRGLRCEEFRVPDLEILSLLVPHIQQAFKLHFQFSELKARSEGIEAALDMLANGVIFLGSIGEVLMMNKRAEEMMKRKSGLLLAKSKLSASVSAESKRLQTMIGGAVRTGIGKGLTCGGTILISREKGRPLSLTLAPLREFNAAGWRRPAAVIFISDPDRTQELPVNLLQHCYGLTQAEARLTMFLLEGRSLKEAAECCGVTHNTAKSQLKIIFLKTDVRRQGELIRLLLNASGVVLHKETLRG